MAISFYTLSLLFGSCRLSEFTLAGPHFTILFALFSVAVQFEPVFVICHHFAVLFSCFKPRERVGGGGSTQQMFIHVSGGSAPRSNPLPFYIPFFMKKVPLL